MQKQALERPHVAGNSDHLGLNFRNTADTHTNCGDRVALWKALTVKQACRGSSWLPIIEHPCTLITPCVRWSQ